MNLPFQEHILALIVGAIITYFFKSISISLGDLKEEVKELRLSLARYEGLANELTEVKANVKMLFERNTSLISDIAVLKEKLNDKS